MGQQTEHSYCFAASPPASINAERSKSDAQTGKAGAWQWPSAADVSQSPGRHGHGLDINLTTAKALGLTTMIPTFGSHAPQVASPERPRFQGKYPAWNSPHLP